MLASSDQIQVVPYDINYIWKYSNNHLFHDELGEQNLDTKTSDYIRRHILKFATGEKEKYVVEKTVSNSLRVNFVTSVFPDAKLIHLYRDGRDASLSALGCWTSSVLDSRNQPLYTYIEKLLKFPYLTASGYLAQRCKELLARQLSSKNHYYWGPRFKGIEELVCRKSLPEVCAYQWAKCIDNTLSQLDKYQIGSDYIPVKYENLVHKPEAEITKICDYIGINDVKKVADFACNEVNVSSIGRWKDQFKLYEHDLLPIMQPALSKLGYISGVSE